jgi:hypothetical protein
VRSFTATQALEAYLCDRPLRQALQQFLPSVPTDLPACRDVLSSTHFLDYVGPDWCSCCGTVPVGKALESRPEPCHSSFETLRRSSLKSCLFDFPWKLLSRTCSAPGSPSTGHLDALYSMYSKHAQSLQFRTQTRVLSLSLATSRHLTWPHTQLFRSHGRICNDPDHSISLR